MKPELYGLNPIETAPRDGTFVLVFGDSGYNSTPLRAEVCRFAAHCPEGVQWRNHANDAYSDGGGQPIGWLPLPQDKAKQEKCTTERHEDFSVTIYFRNRADLEAFTKYVVKHNPTIKVESE